MFLLLLAFRVLRLFVFFFLNFHKNIYYKKLKNVTCEYDRWVVETQLCKLRDTLDTLIEGACAMFQLKYGVCE